MMGWLPSALVSTAFFRSKYLRAISSPFGSAKIDALRARATATISPFI
jgi:hypothetical protein